MDQFIQYTPTEVVFGKETENQAGASVCCNKLIMFQFDDISLLCRNNTGNFAEFARLIRKQN